MKTISFTPDMCAHCGQTTTYLLSLDHGTADIVKAIARKVAQKNLNEVHPRKEMEGDMLTSNQVGNLSRARFHGLIAAVREKPGHYLLTRKGANFLNGEQVPQHAIISKAQGHQIGYLDGEYVTIYDLLREGEYWAGIPYQVGENGSLVKINRQNHATTLF